MGEYSGGAKLGYRSAADATAVEGATESEATRRMSRFAVAHWQPLAVPLLLIPIAQIVAILQLVWMRTQDVPNADEWGMVTLLGKLNTGTAGFQDFWRPNNGHRIVVMRALDLLLIEITHYNRQVMMTVNLAIAVATAVVLLICVRHTFSSARAAIVLAAPLACMIFSLGQFESWMLVFTNNFFTVVFSVALCMWALASGPPARRRLAIAIGAGYLASLSSFPGLALWVVFLPVLWIVGYRRATYLAAWVAAALSIGVPYLIGFHPRRRPRPPRRWMRSATESPTSVRPSASSTSPRRSMPRCSVSDSWPPMCSSITC